MGDEIRERHFNAEHFRRFRRRLDAETDLLAELFENNTFSHRGDIVGFELEDYSRASEELRYFASHHPDSESTFCRLADSLLYSNNFEEAIKVADHLIEIAPEHFHAHTVRGLALIELGHPADGIAALDSLLATDDCQQSSRTFSSSYSTMVSSATS